MAEEIVLKAFIVFICFRASYTIDNSIRLNTSYHNGFLMLQCQVSTTGCCQEAKRIEFKKNGRGVCELKKCNGEFVIPLSRDNAEFYRCFCPGYDLHRAHLLITETRISDYGSWTCECTDRNTDNVCKSNVLVVSETSVKEDIVPVFTNEAETRLSIGWVVSIVIVLVIIIGVLLGIIFVARCYISRRVKIMRGNGLIKLCLGRGEEGTNSEIQDLTSGDKTRKSEDLQEIINFLRATASSSNKLVWCICSQCKERERNSEKLCCNRKECISLHKGFDTYCFKDIDDTPSNDSEEQREKRIRAFKNYNKWGHLIFAAKQRFIIVPACCVEKIRNKYPDPNGEYGGIEQEHIF